MSDSPVLELRGVSKAFGAVQALYEVDFHVSKGEVMALVGDNGAGKSTLIKCIAGIHPVDSGQILFEGEPVIDPRPQGLRAPRDRGRLPGPRALRQPRRGAEHVPRARGARQLPPPRRDGDGGRGPRRRSPGLSVTTLRSRAPDRRRPLRRPAPVGRGRQGRDVELQGRDPRRADRRARRRPDPPGARAGQAPRPAGPRGDPDLAQPARRLRGRRLDHRAPARPERAGVQGAPRPTSSRWSRRSPPVSSPRCRASPEVPA